MATWMNKGGFGFKLLARSGGARLGQITCAHGAVATPAFIPVGTAGTIKAMTPEAVAATGAEMVLANTYHLMLRPGADIYMVLDECTPYPASEADAAKSMRLSMGWAERSAAAFDRRPGYGLFGIVQGGVHGDLRQESAAALIEIGFDGYAVGGLAVGEGQELMLSTLEATVPALPEEAPRYLMGAGYPADIIGAVGRGIDMFDCVLPTRSGRTGKAFTRRGEINIMNARHIEDPRPLDEACRCPACADYSRAYLSHLARAGEMLGGTLMSWHNLQFFQDLMAGLRDAIANDSFDAYAEAFLAEYERGDIEAL